MLARVAGENLTAVTVQHLYNPNLHCLVCCTGKGLEKCHSLCDSCTFQELEGKNICKPNKKKLIEVCVMDQGKKQNLSPYPCNLDLDMETGQHVWKSSTKENKWPSFAKQKCLQCGLSQRHKLSSSQTIWLMSILKIIAFEQWFFKLVSVFSFCKICRHSIFNFQTGSGLIAFNLFTDKCSTLGISAFMPVCIYCSWIFDNLYLN